MALLEQEKLACFADTLMTLLVNHIYALLDAIFIQKEFKEILILTSFSCGIQLAKKDFAQLQWRNNFFNLYNASYFRGANGVLLCFDVSSVDSFN
jgi:hypothetical protein